MTGRAVVGRRTAVAAALLVPLALALVALAAPAGRHADPPLPRERPTVSPHACAAEPTLAEMIGATLMTGFEGTDIEDEGPRRLLAEIAAGRVGGVLFFRRNAESAAAVKRLTHAFARAAPDLPLLVAVDQEGGRVERLTGDIGFREMPSAAWVGNRTEEAARSTYRHLAAALARWGFNVNLGPVVDLARNPDNDVIYTAGRAYSGDPARVTTFARTFVDAHRVAGIATALKHFPGHGSSNGDTHDGVVDITATWAPEELDPFRTLIGEGRADIVMVAHVTQSALAGGDPAPASLSPAIIGDVLRAGLGYDGVVMSDDLDMAAVAGLDTPEAIALRALRAGNDIVVFGSGAGGADLVDRLHAAIGAAAATDRALAGHIAESYRRIARLREGLRRPDLPAGCLRGEARDAIPNGPSVR
jgi:beta-N-acetylhexosaminidase